METEEKKNQTTEKVKGEKNKKKNNEIIKWQKQL